MTLTLPQSGPMPPADALAKSLPESRPQARQGPRPEPRLRAGQPPTTAAPPHPTTKLMLEIPASLADFINQQMLQWKFDDAADYVLNLILNHQELMQLREQLLEGLRAGPSRFFDQAFADELEAFIDAAKDLPPPKEWEGR